MIKEGKIRKLPNGKYRVLSEKGKNLGTFPSKEQAKRRLRQVEYFKHVKANDAKFSPTPFPKPGQPIHEYEEMSLDNLKKAPANTKLLVTGLMNNLLGPRAWLSNDFETAKLEAKAWVDIFLERGFDLKDAFILNVVDNVTNNIVKTIWAYYIQDTDNGNAGEEVDFIKEASQSLTSFPSDEIISDPRPVRPDNWVLWIEADKGYKFLVSDGFEAAKKDSLTWIDYFLVNAIFPKKAVLFYKDINGSVFPKWKKEFKESGEIIDINLVDDYQSTKFPKRGEPIPDLTYEQMIAAPDGSNLLVLIFEDDLIGNYVLVSNNLEKAKEEVKLWLDLCHERGLIVSGAYIEQKANNNIGSWHKIWKYNPKLDKEFKFTSSDLVFDGTWEEIKKASETYSSMMRNMDKSDKNTRQFMKLFQKAFLECEAEDPIERENIALTEAKLKAK